MYPIRPVADTVWIIWEVVEAAVVAAAAAAVAASTDCSSKPWLLASVQQSVDR